MRGIDRFVKIKRRAVFMIVCTTRHCEHTHWLPTNKKPKLPAPKSHRIPTPYKVYGKYSPANQRSQGHRHSRSITVSVSSSRCFYVAVNQKSAVTLRSAAVIRTCEKCVSRNASKMPPFILCQNCTVPVSVADPDPGYCRGARGVQPIFCRLPSATKHLPSSDPYLSSAS